MLQSQKLIWINCAAQNLSLTGIMQYPEKFSKFRESFPICVILGLKSTPTHTSKPKNQISKLFLGSRSIPPLYESNVLYLVAIGLVVRSQSEILVDLNLRIQDFKVSLTVLRVSKTQFSTDPLTFSWDTSPKQAFQTYQKYNIFRKRFDTIFEFLVTS